jgi:hypothetical protein
VVRNHNTSAEIYNPLNYFHLNGVWIGPYYWHHPYPQNPNATQLNAIKTLPIKIWHEQMGYLNCDAIKCVQHENLPLIGIKLDSSKPHDPCDDCIVGKEKCCTFKSSGHHASQPLKIIHSDLMGPIEVLLIGGNQFFAIFVDDYM